MLNLNNEICTLHKSIMRFNRLRLREQCSTTKILITSGGAVMDNPWGTPLMTNARNDLTPLTVTN